MWFVTELLLFIVPGPLMWLVFELLFVSTCLCVFTVALGLLALGRRRRGILDGLVAMGTKTTRR